MGTPLRVEAEGLVVAVFNLDGEYFVTDDACTHGPGSLGEGYVDCHNLTVQCPWHGWTFGLQSGVSPVSAFAKVEKLDVRVEGGEIKVSLE